MSDEKNNHPKRSKKTKEERETQWKQQYLQVWEINKYTGISISKIKYAIKTGDLETEQSCERGMHLAHITKVDKWVAGRKGK